MSDQNSDPAAEPGGCTIPAAWAAAAMLDVGAALIGLFVVSGPAPFGVNVAAAFLALALALAAITLIAGRAP